MNTLTSEQGVNCTSGLPGMDKEGLKTWFKPRVPFKKHRNKLTNITPKKPKRKKTKKSR